MVPAASTHLVFRFSADPIRIFRSLEDYKGDVFRDGVAGGMRSAYYVKDVASRACTVGASLQIGACEAVFGVPASELSDRHVALEDLWGKAARALGQRLQETSDLEKRLQLLESFLAKRLPRALEIHPAVAHALARFSACADIGRVVRETGYSHRHFIHMFRRNVGQPPRVYTRLLRFQQTLQHGIDKGGKRWIDIALEAGYADQAHFNREFRDLAGISPGEYLANHRAIRHVPIPGQFRSRRGGIV